MHEGEARHLSQGPMMSWSRGPENATRRLGQSSDCCHALINKKLGHAVRLNPAIGWSLTGFIAVFNRALGKFHRTVLPYIQKDLQLCVLLHRHERK